MSKDCHPFTSGFLAKQVFVCFFTESFSTCPPSLISFLRHPCRSVFQDNKVNLSQSLDIVTNVFAATWNFHIKAWTLQHKNTPTIFVMSPTKHFSNRGLHYSPYYPAPSCTLALIPTFLQETIETVEKTQSPGSPCRWISTSSLLWINLVMCLISSI